ncbi:hypothetical protein [Pectobacterium carotovorum]|uniref:hypothetical protein n=1 Tax=Pectobacterium carotovorum TaxID=554 RepID=UPI00050462C7|nr:hypothetical protein [Pectobacterium carotovorum]KFW97554.1 hypothetical protein JV33_21710 [Pectobacterium carotovorum subsp. carotovorum]KML64932.1 hypothetical protein G032_20925 [Pectobacterium carotovorum subsp. carotovorum ICMP 5702]SHH72890.1 hypothetical protein SAMN05444147_1212 [Pectobacterium carotovorum]
MATTFYESMMPVFKRVCAFLGNGWRVDQRRDDDSYRIHLFTPALPNYGITVRHEKDRLILTGSPLRHQSYNDYSCCTVAPTRDPCGIARDIKKKILADAQKLCDKAAADLAGSYAMKEERKILLNLLTRLIETRDYDNYHGVLCEIRAHSIRGDVLEGYGDTYNLKLSGLSKDQLIKLAGFISTLER